MMLSHLQKPPREANFQFTPSAASIPFPRRVSPPLSPSLSGSPPPPPFSSSRLPAPHASARHGAAWIWRVMAYLPRLLVGERVLEVLLLPPASPSAPPAGLGPPLLLGRRGTSCLPDGLGGRLLLGNRRGGARRLLRRGSGGPRPTSRGCWSVSASEASSSSSSHDASLPVAALAARASKEDAISGPMPASGMLNPGYR